MKGTDDDVQVQLVDISSSATNDRESSSSSIDIYVTLQQRNIDPVNTGPFDDKDNNAALQLFYVLAASGSRRFSAGV